MFWLFMVCRGIVGVGEATYSNVSPSMITDMFTGQTRARMYMFFYMAVPIGSGLGFVVGSSMSSLLGSWQWGVRSTAVVGIIGLVLLVIFLEEPKGVQNEAKAEETRITASTSFLTDLKDIFSNKTYLNVTIGYTALVFCVGTMAWWIPTVAEHGIAAKDGLNSTDQLDDKTRDRFQIIY
ncbi:unnamed protein product [Caenorhabditis auriculariae]|uniref:Major facilitator superfamily (MFS) profile domain-containing protein n=1 Tax=Caenorhabditis auriculariae TaxID=2777116 RepID=A0A8S1H5X0_9PELO|nr:unnamed protein product [Caenorhabditis auriculariae]